MFEQLSRTRFRRAFTAAALLLASSLVSAQTGTKQELATQFLAVTTADAQLNAVIKQTAHAMLLRNPNAEKLAPVYETWLLKVFRSEEYARMQTSVYMEQFTEDELRLLVDLSRHPGFQLYASRLQQVMQVSSARLLPILRARDPELRSALEATGVWPPR